VEPAERRVLQALHLHAHAAEAREEAMPSVRLEEMVDYHVWNDVSNRIGVPSLAKCDSNDFPFLQVAERRPSAVSGVKCGVYLNRRS
jgi:hypothetical protein